MRRRPRAEEPIHHERWLVSYADLMTLLFALFVVLFASSHHDRKTIRRVSSAVKNGFQQLGSFSESNNALDPTQSKNPNAPGVSDGQDLGPNDGVVAPGSDGIDVVELRKKLDNSLGREIERKEVVLRMTNEGFVISLHELGFFDSGNAQLLPGAEEKIKRIATVLMQYGLDMRVEGHSDDIPIHNATFASNWDLSTARAMAVSMMLLNDSHFDPKRLSIAGYAQYHPSASNSTAEGRRANRRVDIVILSVSKPPAPTTP